MYIITHIDTYSTCPCLCVYIYIYIYIYICVCVCVCVCVRQRRDELWGKVNNLAVLQDKCEATGSNLL